ncbi:hypothetical protein BGZ94_004954 [Podila epigama]|nr:hypothetical protein BGZ94_004954 [Podila epigama]
MSLRRRQSTGSETTGAGMATYVHPAASQFLRLGVGIDHVDVEHSGDEDAVYHDIESGMEGHDHYDVSEDDDEEEEENEEEEEEDEDEEDDEKEDEEKGEEDNGIDKKESKGPREDNTIQCCRGENVDEEITAIGATLPSPTADVDGGTNLRKEEEVASQSSSTQQPLNTTTTITITTITNDSHTSPVTNGKQQQRSIPGRPGLPVSHERPLSKIHGSSPLSNSDNTITASETLALSSTAQQEFTRHPTAAEANENLNTKKTNNETERQPLPVRRFAEKDGMITIHAWKIHYKVCYPTLDPLYRINGNGRNIVLFHGALSNLGTWHKVQQALADRTGCRVLSYDRIGYGHSDKPATWPKNANPYKSAGVLAVCQTLLETLGMHQNLILVGNGTGATIASALALSTPANVRGLLLVAPSILDESPPMYLRACVSYPPPLCWIYRGLYGNHGPLQQLYYKPTTIMSDPKTIEMYMAPTRQEGFWRGLGYATKHRSRFRIMEHLDKLTELSILVMTGDVDDVVPTIETLRFFERMQTVRKANVPQVLKIIKHAGHLPQEEKPMEFVKVASFFIKKVCLGSLSRERSVGGRRMSTGVMRSGSRKSAGGSAGGTESTRAGEGAGVTRHPSIAESSAMTGGEQDRVSSKPRIDAKESDDTHASSSGSRVHYHPPPPTELKAC